MSVIKSDEYRREQAALQVDLIVQAMADEVRGIPEAKRVGDLAFTSHNFMMRALNEYKKRGGTNAHSIGSVAIAIRAILGCPEPGD